MAIIMLHPIGPSLILDRTCINVYGNKQNAALAHLSHSVATQISCNMELTSAVLLIIFKSNWCPHVLYMSGKRDLCIDRQGIEHCCSQASICCKGILTVHCIKKNEEQIRENSHFSRLRRAQICCLCWLEPFLQKMGMTLIYGWKMEVEVVMTPYEGVIRKCKRLSNRSSFLHQIFCLPL